MSEPQQPPAQFTIGLPELVEVIVQQAQGVHKHDWAILDVSYPEEKPTADMHPRYIPEMAAQQPVTYVAMRCSCGEPTSVTMDGHWTMEQLMREVHRGVSEHQQRQGQEG